MLKDTTRLLEAWREAERTASAARMAAEHAQQAAEAASKAAEAARIAAEDAGVTLEAADVAASHAKDAYHLQEADVRAHSEQDSKPPPALGEMT